MRSRSPLVPEEDGTLYHGTSSTYVGKLLAGGGQMLFPSYWGTERIAEYYAEVTAEEDVSEPVVIAVSRAEFKSRYFQPDHKSIAEPLCCVLEAKEPALYQEWTKSKGTWRDSLSIYESVVYAATVHITAEHLPEP